MRKIIRSKLVECSIRFFFFLELRNDLKMEEINLNVNDKENRE